MGAVKLESMESALAAVTALADNGKSAEEALRSGPYDVELPLALVTVAAELAREAAEAEQVSVGQVLQRLALRIHKVSGA
jgi:hypothetical protein